MSAPRSSPDRAGSREATGAAVDRLGSPAWAGVGAAPGDLDTFTVADFLALPGTLGAAPVVLAGEQHLGRWVRWLHVSELADRSELLQGGELVLARGSALTRAPAQLAAVVDGLADQQASGLVLQLGGRLAEVPPALVRACDRRHLPLVVLRRPVEFGPLCEQAHAVLLAGQRRLLQTAAAAHERFAELGAVDASVGELVAAAGELAGGHVLFADLLHRVVAVHAGPATAEVLHRWTRTAFTVGQVLSVQVDDRAGTVVAPVEVRGQRRGHLVLFAAAPPTRTQVVVLERAAAALALRLLVEDDVTVLATAQRCLLSDVVTGRSGSTDAVHARAAALGHPTRGRHYLPVVLLDARDELEPVLGRALDEVRVDALVARLDPDRWGVLLLLPDEQPGPAETFAAVLHDLCAAGGLTPPVVARGLLVSELADVRRSFGEADEVALASGAAGSAGPRRGTHSMQDVQLRGLLFTLRDDPRVQAFVERTLGPLLLRDARDGEHFVQTVSAYLARQGNKSLTARDLGISRPTLYERIGRVQRLLGVDLDDPETSTSLHAAVMLVESTSLMDPVTGQVQLHPVGPRRG